MEHTLEEIKFMFGNQLKNRRKELGLTQEEVAKRMGVLQPHIGRAEVVGPRTVDMLLQWCMALDMKLTIEPMVNPALVEKAMDDPEALDELIDAPPEEIVEYLPTAMPTLKEANDPDNPEYSVRPPILMHKNGLDEVNELQKMKGIKFCKHGAVKGLCKKGCK